MAVSRHLAVGGLVAVSRHLAVALGGVAYIYIYIIIYVTVCKCICIYTHARRFLHIQLRTHTHVHIRVYRRTNCRRNRVQNLDWTLICSYIRAHYELTCVYVVCISYASGSRVLACLELVMLVLAGLGVGGSPDSTGPEAGWPHALCRTCRKAGKPHVPLRDLGPVGPADSVCRLHLALIASYKACLVPGLPGTSLAWLYVSLQPVKRKIHLQKEAKSSPTPEALKPRIKPLVR